MTDYPAIGPVKTALLAAIGYLDNGNIEGARHFCRQVLAADPKHPQVAILAVWIAAHARDEAAFRQALQAMTEANGIWATVPRLPSLEGPPLFLDGRLEALFGDRTPPVSDISDHLGDLYFEAVAARPRLIVELGTRGGESTRAPKVAPRGVLIFHDTHMAAAYVRSDGSIGGGWDNRRGVIRAIEELLGRDLDETRYLAGIANGWAFRHIPKSNGFTILRRIPTKAG